MARTSSSLRQPKGRRWRSHAEDGSQLADPGGDGWIAKDHHLLHMRRDLLEQLQPFPAHAVFVNGEPGRVAARMCQARDETGADRHCVATGVINGAQHASVFRWQALRRELLGEIL
jgi:hypothetical protein